MALRVLLADESATIKKVFQLALQDFAVEVMSVNSGLDALPVAEKFKPDIVFADVLLQKQSGYDVVKELKAHKAFRNTPCVLVWSGFMELDQAKYSESGAESHLEKPFEADQLRELIQSLVPKTKTQALSQFLDFPDMPEFEENEAASDESEEATVHPLPNTATAIPEATSDWSMDNFSPLESSSPNEDFSSEDDFVEMPLPVATETPTETSTDTELELLNVEDEESDSSSWVSTTLHDFKLDTEALNRPDEVTFDVPTEPIETSQLLGEEPSTPPSLPINSRALDVDSLETLEAEDLEMELELEGKEAGTPPLSAVAGLPQERLESIIRAEARQAIEKVLWEIVPELATQIIEREIRKVLQEQDESRL